MMTFWQTLPNPFFVLAPMEDVTDIVFRTMVARCGRPDVFFTEFTSADGLLSAGREQVAERLLFSADEHPIVAQIWGNNPDTMLEAARLVRSLGFDGVDINMGCPQRKFVSKGFCAGLIRTPELAKQLYLAAKEGAGDIPVSIKTRIGYDHIQTEEWIGFLLALDPAALTVHGRTVKEMSLVPAHWDEINRAVQLRNQMGKKMPIIGNGDVLSLSQGASLAETHHTDGVMIGRGIFENIALFDKKTGGALPSFPERLCLLQEHIRLFEKTWKGKKPFLVMKKFFKIYISDIPHAHQLRADLMSLNTADEALTYISRLSDTYQPASPLSKNSQSQ